MAGIWNLRATELPAAARPPNYKLGFCAEIIGRDDNYRYQRAFRPRLIKGPDDIGKAVWYSFRPRAEPYLLDIRHEQRGYYVLHAGIQQPELVQIAESLLAELLISRELEGALFSTTMRDAIRNIWDRKLKRGLLKTLDKAAGDVIKYDLELPEPKRAEPPAVIDRQRIRRVHFDS